MEIPMLNDRWGKIMAVLSDDGGGTLLIRFGGGTFFNGYPIERVGDLIEHLKDKKEYRSAYLDFIPADQDQVSISITRGDLAGELAIVGRLMLITLLSSSNRSPS